MSTPWIFRVMVALMISTALPATARADNLSPEKVRALVEAGSIQPLERILQGLPGDYRGRLLDAEVEREEGIWVYELELLGDNGHVREILIDAKTGKILKVEQE